MVNLLEYMITSIDTNTALVLIDLQNSIVSAPMAHPVDDILDNVNKLIAAFREMELPVFVINVNLTGTAWTNSRKEIKSLAPPADLTEYQINDKINITVNDIRITKHTWNAFFETPLDDELKKKSVTGIVLAGIATSLGVEGTARAASELGYNITFAVDAMTDREEAAHQRSLQYLFPRMGETGSTAEIIQMLEKEAK